VIKQTFKRILRRIAYEVIEKPPIDRNFRDNIFSRVDQIQGWLPMFESYLLFSLATIKPRSAILEIGSYQGRSTLSLALADASNFIQSVDPHTGDISEANAGIFVNTESNLRENLKRNNVLNVGVYVGTSEKFFFEGETQFYDLVFIDGWHSYEAVVQDINFWATNQTEDFIIAFDDWMDPQVNRAIRDNLAKLPSYKGWVGKVAVFSNLPNERFGRFDSYWRKQKLFQKTLRLVNASQIAKRYHSASFFER
jgi:predicted O-methyltransferase YrrM